MPKREQRSACVTLIAQSESLLESNRKTRAYDFALLEHCRGSIAHSRWLLSLPVQGADTEPSPGGGLFDGDRDGNLG